MFTTITLYARQYFYVPYDKWTLLSSVLTLAFIQLKQYEFPKVFETLNLGSYLRRDG